eukprot:TRINITY_DN29574_c0_g1_i2.p1 TRINITY_DN29574_c0_g1~~TRINITY_DN29574_c0_g1_i2.p1  ORF type:complete len:428 (+),score=94.25 TRINITY_DN29574_c0_g1_i2:81-1364(+)
MRSAEGATPSGCSGALRPLAATGVLLGVGCTAGWSLLSPARAPPRAKPPPDPPPAPSAPAGRAPAAGKEKPPGHASAGQGAQPTANDSACSGLLRKGALAAALPHLIPNASSPPPALLVIGANTGNPRDAYWLPWATGLPKVLVEPVAPNFRALEAVVRRRGLQRATLLNAAVGNASGGAALLPIWCPLLAAVPVELARRVDAEMVAGQVCSLSRPYVLRALQWGARSRLNPHWLYTSLLAAAFRIQLPPPGLPKVPKGAQKHVRGRFRRYLPVPSYTINQRRQLVSVVEAPPADPHRLIALLGSPPDPAAPVARYANLSDMELLRKAGKRYILGDVHIIKYDVPVLSPREVVRRANLTLPSVAYVQVDTEGHDAAVVAALPWDDPVVNYESATLSARDQTSTLALLRRHGYACCADKWNTIALAGG